MTSLVVGQRPCPGLHSRRANRCRAVSPLAESYPIFRSLLPKAGTEKAESAEQPEQQPSTGLGALSKLLPLAQPTSIDPLAEALANEGADTAPPAIGVAGGGIFYFWEVVRKPTLLEHLGIPPVATTPVPTQ